MQGEARSWFMSSQARAESGFMTAGCAFLLPFVERDRGDEADKVSSVRNHSYKRGGSLSSAKEALTAETARTEASPICATNRHARRTGRLN